MISYLHLLGLPNKGYTVPIWDKEAYSELDFVSGV
jgi:hypothetical protein